MTRLFLSVDLEGAAGITAPSQCFAHLNATAYQRAVTQLVDEVNTVIEAAFAHGATAITVNDAHGYMANLPYRALDSRVSVLSGKPKRCAMAAGLDAHFDAMMLLGYHAKAGTERGILCHTFHDKLFDVSVNGHSLGEAGFNALYASHTHGVPVVLFSGDQALGAEVAPLLPQALHVQTKTSLSFSAALSKPWTEVQQAYQHAVKALFARKADWKSGLLQWPGPYTLTVTFINPLCADIAETLPWVQRLDGVRVQAQAEDFQTLYQALQSLYVVLAYPVE